MSLPNAYSTFIRLVTLRWWTWRITRRLLFAGAVLATLIILLYVVENWRGRRAFAAASREAAVQGLSLALRDHAPPPVDDALNFAKLPLLDHPLVDNEKEPFWSDLKKRFHIEAANRLDPPAPPSEGLPSVFENMPADLAALRAGWQKLVAESSAENQDGYLARLAPVLDELSAATIARPRLRYEYEWEKGYAIPLPHLGALRAISRAATLRSLIDLEHNDPAGAARALRIPLLLRTSLQPDLISQLVAASIGGSAYAHIWQGQLRHQWAPAELDLFATLLADDHILDGGRRAFCAETAVGVTFALQMANSDQPGYPDFENDSGVRVLARFHRYAPSGWASQNAALLVRLGLDELIPSINPVSARVHPEKIRFPESPPTVLSMPYQAIARVVSPSLTKIVLTIGHAKSSQDLARLAVALEKHRLARGAYPDSLAPVLAADPALAALHDPFDGNPYRYRRDADGGFTLWGVGRDARDDGAAYPSPKKSGGPDYDTGDIVWRVPGA